MPDDIPTFEEYEKRKTPKPPGPTARWFANNPNAFQIAADLLDQGKPAKTITRYLNEYYGFPFKSEALVFNVTALRDDS